MTLWWLCNQTVLALLAPISTLIYFEFIDPDVQAPKHYLLPLRLLNAKSTLWFGTWRRKSTLCLEMPSILYCILDSLFLERR